jgi:hypothetical protein
MSWNQQSRGGYESYPAQRARKERERRRQEISADLLVFTSCTGFGVAVLTAGFFMPSRDGGWFALSLFCWIAGGTFTLLFGGFLAGTLLRARKFWRGRS